MLEKLLEIRRGVTAVIGGGGKTTLLRTLGEELAKKGNRVLLCTTTKILPFPGLPCALDEAQLLRMLDTELLLCAGTLLENGKLTVPETPMDCLAAWFDYVLVEADGSARRPLKAHAPHEPVVPPEVGQVISVVGASGFGRPIAEAAHRPELYAKLAGVVEADAATPDTAAAVLLVEGLHHRVYINQVETQEDLDRAVRLAGQLHCPVVAGSLLKGVYFVCS